MGEDKEKESFTAGEKPAGKVGTFWPLQGILRSHPAKLCQGTRRRRCFSDEHQVILDYRHEDKFLQAKVKDLEQYDTELEKALEV